MKRHVPPGAVVTIVILAILCVFACYWKGLLGQPKGAGGPMAGGGGGAPPPRVGLRNVTVTTLAGPLPLTHASCEGGFADARGRAARFDGPSAVAVDAQGVVWVTDSRNHRVRRVAPDGTVTTIVGGGPTGATLGAFSDGAADAARMWNPSGVALTADGSIYLADTGNHRLRAVAGGQVRTLAGGDTPLDAFGLCGGAFRDGPGAAAQLRYPTGLVRRPDGVLLVADTGNCKVRAVTPDGATTTFADLAGAGGKSPCGLALMPDGRVLVADPAAGAVFVIGTDHGVSLLPNLPKGDPTWSAPTALVVSPQGVIYVADSGNHGILRIPPGGAPQLIAGTVPLAAPSPGFLDGTGDRSGFAVPCGIALDAAGALYVADFGNNAIRKLVIGPEIQPRRPRPRRPQGPPGGQKGPAPATH